MNKLFHISLFLIYVTALLVPFYPVADYLLNKDFIAKTYCENKDKPQMHCNGKCHMMKQLKKAAEENQPKGPTHIVIENFLPHFAYPAQSPFVVYYTPVPPLPSSDQQAPKSELIFSVFHPPQC